MPSPAEHRALIKDLSATIAEETDSDIFLYNGDIGRPYDQEIINTCRNRRRRKNIILVLCTEGGDPDAAYRIARCFQEYYSHFSCMVAGYCKSAGTLIVLGAHSLVMDDGGELGPLDIQMSKRDELGESQSGLIVGTALKALTERSFTAFEHYFMTIKKKGRRTISFRMATEIASKLTAGLFGHIFQQIDPLHLGETYRATALAQHYGVRLNEYGHNLAEGALDDLITQYPSHGFVIDRNEARGIFTTVREPADNERLLLVLLGENAEDPLPRESARREFLNDELPEKVEYVPAPEANPNIAPEPTGGQVVSDAG